MRIILVMCPWLMHLLASEVVVSVVDTYTDYWTHQYGAHPLLAGTFALLLGEPLYTLPTEGPYISWMYGPLGALGYFPAILARDPVSAMRIAKTLSLCFVFTPLLIIARLAPVPAKEKLASVAVVLLLSFFFFRWNRPLNEAFSLRFEYPAVLVTVLSIALLAKGTVSNRTVVLSSILAISAVWIKQTFMIVPVAPLAALILSGRRREARTWALSCVLSAIVGLGVASIWLGFAPLKFVMLDYPRSFPWVSDIVVGQLGNDLIENPTFFSLMYVLLRAVREILHFTLPVLIPFLILVGVWHQARDSREERPRLTALEFMAVSTALCALLFMPTGAVGRVKHGGFVNSYTPVVYFLFLSCSSLYFHLVSSRREGRFLLLHSLFTAAIGAAVFETGARSAVLLGAPAYAAVGRRFRTASRIGLSLSLVLLPFVSLPMVRRNHQVVSTALQNPQISEAESAYAYAIANPGRVYFFDAPLFHLLSEGRLYNTAQGVWDYSAGGYVIPRDQFMQNVPARMEMVALSDEGLLSQLKLYFPGYDEEVEVQELSGFRVFVNRQEEHQTESTP